MLNPTIDCWRLLDESIGHSTGPPDIKVPYVWTPMTGSASGHDSVAHRGKPRLHDHMVPGSILPWAPPFGKREDSCKPPQGERLYPCAWFQVQDPSAARLDLAHVSLVSADDILRIRRVPTLVSPTAEPNSNRSLAPSERALIVLREGAEPKLSHRSVLST